MRNIKGIIFDFDATLGKSHLDKKAFHLELYYLLKDEIGITVSPEAFLASITMHLNDADKVRMKSQKEYSFQEYYNYAFSQMHISIPADLFFQIQAVAWENFHFELYDGAAEALYKLRQAGISLAIVSNTVYGTTFYSLEQCGLISLFNVVIQSCDVGLRKPDPNIFLMALYQMALQPSDAISVGNSPYFDIWGAHKAGLKTVLVNTEVSYREPDNFDDAVAADFTIEQIKDLPIILGI